MEEIKVTVPHKAYGMRSLQFWAMGEWAKGERVQWGCMEQNFWFKVGAGVSPAACRAYAVRRLRRLYPEALWVA